MQFMSRSTSPNRPTRKKDRKVQRKFNSGLKGRTDDATRRAARMAKVAGAQKVLDDATAVNTVAKDKMLGLVGEIAKSPNDPGLQEQFKKQELVAAAASSAMVQAAAALGTVTRKVETKNRREAVARLARREVCLFGAMKARGANLYLGGAFHKVESHIQGTRTGRFTQPGSPVAPDLGERTEAGPRMVIEKVDPDKESFF